MSTVARTALKWAPRLASVVLGGGYVVLAAGEIITPHAAAPSGWREWGGIGLCTVACLAPLGGWRWPMAGAAVSLGALAAFAGVAGLRRYDVLFVMAMPALLFLLERVTTSSRR